MTNIIKSKYKASRRLGSTLWGSSKDAYNKRNYPPGQHGNSYSKAKVSDFGDHLKAKQLIKMHYGRITSKQFKNVFLLARKAKGNTAENFAGLLERRLDIVVYRMNFAPTIFAARQLVSHGHVMLNRRRVNIASIRLSVSDTIEIKDTSKNLNICKDSLARRENSIPEYLSVDSDKMSGCFVRVPKIDDIPYPFKPDFSKVVEYFSR
ncbi:30S ribosomal protein S4 [Rickettsia endosymbiont of Cardiosporidium cionae]|uniref:30S ribosomal protein S4 n=1 Tax=Rickettsia endosymbiont of Cardiosporidium cionae TaxID=2777155 RepID=UPI00189340BD|nr:30S ribosomal protein S4 [Rickettsia endosymbiont of Cardiosporidium cionae]KAF8818240.1 30S ribosomal protein S4 [Rickettsia endosymbiont of Cardiosporidium cionae]